ncbi:phage baseplate assembly protein V, partial [Capnocytophaga canis]
IRVMTPDAGGSDKVSKNRGFVAIPEIGDQVMVGFIHNHPDRPYVMGSLFHGKVGSGGGSGNNVKSLSSKSGHTIELNDAGGITIRDKSGGDMIVLDGTNKITVTSTQTIELNNGKSAIKLDKNKITIHADEIEISKTEGDASKVEIKGLETLISGKNNVTVKSEGKMLLDSQGAMDVKSTGTLTASGSTAKLESKGITEVKGATVNIN